MTPRSAVAGPPGRPALTGSVAAIAAAARRMTLNVPMRLTRIVRSNASSGAGPSRPTVRFAVTMPAQFTATRSGAERRGRVDRGLHLGLVRDVRRDEAGPLAELGRGLVAARAGQVDEHDGCPAVDECARRGAPEARGPTGDDR